MPNFPNAAHTVICEGHIGEAGFQQWLYLLLLLLLLLPLPLLLLQEDERTRKPWLPSLDGELHSFDDLFSNSVEPAGEE